MPASTPIPSSPVPGLLTLVRSGEPQPVIRIGVDPGKQGAAYLRNSDGSCLTWVAWWWQASRGGHYTVVTGPTLRRFEVASMAELGAKLGRALAGHPERRYVLHIEAIHVRASGPVNPQTAVVLAQEAGRFQGALEALAGQCLKLGESPSPAEWSRVFMPKWDKPPAAELTRRALAWAQTDAGTGDTWLDADIPVGPRGALAEARAMAHWGASPEAVDGHWAAKATKAAKAARRRAEKKEAKVAGQEPPAPKGVPGMPKRRRKMPKVT